MQDGKHLKNNIKKLKFYRKRRKTRWKENIVFKAIMTDKSLSE